MNEFEDFEGLSSSKSMEGIRCESLSDAQLEYMKELKVPEEEWKEMSPLDQLDQLKSIEERFYEFSPTMDIESVFENIYGSEMYETFLQREEIESLFQKLEAPNDTMQIESISDILVECSELEYANWEKLTTEEKTEVLNKLEGTIAQIECRPACPVSFRPMEEGCYGGYCEGRKDITLNENLLENSPSIYRELIDTIIHEGRHAYQDYNIHVQEIHPRHAEVNSWRDTWGDGKWEYKNDCRTELGLRLYEQQSIEIDARNFAADVLDKFIYKQFEKRL